MDLKIKLYCLILTLFFLTSCGLPVKEYERVSILRERVIKYPEVQTYAQDEFNIAENGYVEADAIMKEEKKDEAKKAKELLLTSETNFNIVLEKGLPGYAETLQTETDQSITNAQEIKANVMYGEEYAQAETTYQEAMSFLNTDPKDYESAIAKLLQAKEEYTQAYNLAKEQYDKSDEALASVKKRLQDLEKMTKEIEALQKKK